VTENAVQNQTQQQAAVLAEIVKSQWGMIEAIMPRHLTAKRFARNLYVACQRTPKVLLCSRDSIIGSMIEAAQLGLEPGVGGQGEILPYKTKEGWKAQFIPGYRGLMKLARQSGTIGSFMAETVDEADHFEFKLGTNPKIDHVPGESPTGNVTHAYAVAHLLGTDDWQFAVMTRAQIEEVRKGSKAGNFGPWKSNWPEMAKKTVIRRLCKLLDTSPEVQRAVTMDELADAGVAQQTEAVLPEDFRIPEASIEADQEVDE
jgi:recombination protein RecT